MSNEPPSRRRASVTVYPDGPLLLRGDVDLLGPDGTVLPRRRRTVALCRCGHSALTPWCDGTHQLLRDGDRRARRVLEAEDAEKDGSLAQPDHGAGSAPAQP